MFTNLGNGKFSDVAHPLRCDELEESRGVAVVDLNKDGQLDLVINNNDAAPTIYLNRISGPGAYFRCNLTGAGVSESATMASSLDAIGARVEVDIQIADEKRTLVRQVEAGSGYAAQSEPSLHFGLGTAKSIDEIRIAWPSGVVQKIEKEELAQLELVNRECRITEGQAPVVIPVPRATPPAPPADTPAPAPADTDTAAGGN